MATEEDMAAVAGEVVMATEVDMAADGDGRSIRMSISKMMSTREEASYLHRQLFSLTHTTRVIQLVVFSFLFVFL